MKKSIPVAVVVGMLVLSSAAHATHSLSIFNSPGRACWSLTNASGKPDSAPWWTVTVLGGIRHLGILHGYGCFNINADDKTLRIGAPDSDRVTLVVRPSPSGAATAPIPLPYPLYSRAPR